MAEVILQGKDHKKPIRVDMTPMVDLGFLLITFFMLATTLTKPNNIEMKLPAKGPNSSVIDQRNQITFILGKDNQVFYHQGSEKDLTAANLKQATFNGIEISKIIDQAKSKAPKPENFTVIIEPTDQANYKNFVDMLDNISMTPNNRYGVTEMKAWEKKVYQEKLPN